MKTGWIRLTRSCNAACVFCDQRDHLDGRARPWGQVAEEIRQLPRGGHLILAGGEPTLSPHLLKAISYGRECGLTVSLTTNGVMLQSPKHHQMLKSKGLTELNVSFHGGRRLTHDYLTGTDGAWIKSLACIRKGCEAGLDVGVHYVVTVHNHDEIARVMHLVRMAGVRRMDLYEVTGQPELRQDLPIALRLLHFVWLESKDEEVHLTWRGLEHSVDAGIAPQSKPVIPVKSRTRRVVKRFQPDPTLFGLLLDRVHVHRALAEGVQWVDDDGRVKKALDWSAEFGGLQGGVAALDAFGVKSTDVALCLGGTHRGTTGSCERCDLPTCGGGHERLKGKASSETPWWWQPSAGGVAVVAPQDDPLARQVLQELGDKGHAVSPGGALPDGCTRVLWLTPPSSLPEGFEHVVLTKMPKTLWPQHEGQWIQLVHYRIGLSDYLRSGGDPRRLLFCPPLIAGETADSSLTGQRQLHSAASTGPGLSRSELLSGPTPQRVRYEAIQGELSEVQQAERLQDLNTLAILAARGATLVGRRGIGVDDLWVTAPGSVLEQEGQEQLTPRHGVPAGLAEGRPPLGQWLRDGLKPS